MKLATAATTLLVLLGLPSVVSPRSATAADLGPGMVKFTAAEEEYKKKLEALEAERMAKEVLVVKAMHVELIDKPQLGEHPSQEELAKSVEIQRWNRFAQDWINAGQNDDPDRTRVMLLRNRRDLEEKTKHVGAEATAKRP